MEKGVFKKVEVQVKVKISKNPKSKIQKTKDKKRMMELGDGYQASAMYKMKKTN